jgi:type I restriction enzyme M protein
MSADLEGSDALGFENELWASANKMRGNMDASEYKHVVLPLVFLKYISDAFEDIYASLVSRGRNPENRDEYIAKGVFWVPEKGRWNNLVKNATDPSIGIMIDDAMEAIERDNPELRNVLPKNFGSSDLSSRVLGEVVTLFGNMQSFGDEDARSKDVIGRVYEYFIGKFAEAEKKGGGEFYTPRSVVRLLTEILQPYEGRIYDGCCGSGGMFVQSLKFMEAHAGRINASVWGQESNPTTWRLAKMNLAIRRIDANLGESHEDTLVNDYFPDLRADFTIVNPPFNIKDWGFESLQDDPRWMYGVPPKGNANYAWIQHYLHHLSPQGMAGIVMSNGSLSTTRKEEKIIREGIINDDKLDCVIMLPDKLFTNTGISACIWILSNSKTDSKFRSRNGETLFIDCRGMGTMVNRTLRELTADDVAKVAGTYQNWRSNDSFDDYGDERGFCKAVTTANEITEHEYIIVPGRYVGAPPLPDDGEPFEDKMKRLTSELGEHFAESRRLEDEIRKNLGDLGFDF